MVAGKQEQRGNASGLQPALSVTSAVPAARAADHLATIVESSQDAIFSRALDGTILSWNAGAEKLYGYPAAEMLGRKTMLMIPPERQAESQDNWKRVHRGEMVAPYETVRLTKDGRRIAVSLCLSPLRDAAGKVDGIAIIVRDITGLKQIEEALRRSEARLRAIIELEPECVSIINASGELLEMNRSGLDMLETRTVAEARHYGVLNFVLPAYRDAVRNLHGRVLSGERGELEYEIVGRSGTRRVVHAFATPFYEPGSEVPSILSITRDVTERKSSDEARANLAAIVQSSNDAIISRSLEGYVTSWNRGAEQMFGYTAREVIGQHVGFLLPPGEMQRTDEHNEIVRRGEATTAHEAQRLAKDGRTVHVMMSHSPLRNDDGEVTGASVIFHDITAVRQTQAALRASEERFRAAFDQASVGMALRNISPARPRWLRVNQKLCDMLGYTRDELLQLDSYDITPQEDIEQSRQYNERVQRGEIPGYNREMRYVRKDGQIIWVNVSLSAVHDGSDPPSYVVAVIEDISERKRAEEQLVLASQAIASAAEGILITDASRRIVNVNKAFTRITGYLPEEVIGKTPDMFNAGTESPGLRDELWVELERTGYWQGEIWNRRKSGDAYAELMTISSVKNSEGRTTHYVAVFNDISPLKEYEARLEYLAHHDSLTGLPTRSLLRDRVEVAIAQAEREGQHFALLFVDLDRFKIINDTMGHEVGDQVLQAVSLRLKETLRGSDTVSRHGGDEFLVLLPTLGDIHDAGRVAEKLIQQVALPYEVGSRELVVTSSIGIAIYPENGRDLDQLLRNADAAMYAAKQGGRNRYQYYTRSMNTQAADRATLERELRLALVRDELHVEYQPQVNLVTGELVGFEALMRWRHPWLGQVAPARFIPVAEENGQMVVLGEWILREACRQRSEWRRRGLVNVPVAVNVSAVQLREPNFVQRVRAILLECDLEAGQLELEITESLLMQGSEAMVAGLHDLHRLGVHIALDDFGTGYSSLSYLRQFPLHRMKIDQCFVRDLPQNSDAAVITEAIATLGRALGLRVVAEGVETEAQAAFLRNTSCQDAQGRLYSRPLPAAEFEEWLRREHAAASASQS